MVAVTGGAPCGHGEWRVADRLASPDFVKKAVNWALRQIGKRSGRMRDKAIAVAENIATIDSRAARWIASDALRELRSIPEGKRVRTPL
jgi:3-methyladenine DNA glycosylase AlkD